MAIMGYTFARVSAVVGLARGDYRLEGKRARLRLLEKGSKEQLVWLHTLYAWKAKYGGMDVSQAQEAKQLRDENTKLRKLVADLSLDKEALQSVIRKNGWSS
jgi:putative transposase